MCKDVTFYFYDNGQKQVNKLDYLFKIKFFPLGIKKENDEPPKKSETGNEEGINGPEEKPKTDTKNNQKEEEV